MLKRTIGAVLALAVGTTLLLPLTTQASPNSTTTTNGTRTVATSTTRVGTNSLSTATATPAVSTSNNNNTAQANANNDNQTLLILPNFPGNNFLVQAAADSLFEIQLGYIAATNSSNGDIQRYGQGLVADHTTAFQQAQELADSMGVTLRGLSTQQQQVVRYFRTLTGEQFDRVFTRYVIQLHMQDIHLFEVVAIRSTTWDIRRYAAQNLPVLMRHLTIALDIRETLLGNPVLSQ